jgi:SAM-dependent methyltransferase
VEGPDPNEERTARVNPAEYTDGLASATSEAAYDALAAYGLARTYVSGRSVADIGLKEVGRGSLVLAEAADAVVGLADSDEAVEFASTAYTGPNVDYRMAALPKLPYPDDQFDVVVAFGVLGRLADPEELVREARRVLKGDGVFVVSVPDKLFVREMPGGGNMRGMHAVEARGLLERHFVGVRVYRLGAVAGGFVFPDSEDASEVEEVRIESARLSFAAPAFDSGPPKTRSIMAVCGEPGALGEGRPYLLLDRDRRVFDECEDRAEEAELVREEIRRIQATEAQAFQESLKLHRSEVSFLRAQVRRSESRARQLEGRARQLEGRIRELSGRIQEMENSATWRVFEPYRQLRTRVDAVRKPGPGGGEDRRPG